MQDTTKVSESDVRHLIYKLNIKLGLRWALLGVLDCVDWSTLAGEVSQRVIVEKMNVHRGTLQRSLKELEELGLISINRRVSERGAHRRAHYRISLKTLQSMVKTEATPMPLTAATPMPLTAATHAAQ